MDIIEVSELTKRVKQMLEGGVFQQLAVIGEISNFTHHVSGHMYFTLKDAGSRVKTVMFRGKNRSLSFSPTNGQTVVAVGNLGVYEPNGEYQLYVDKLLPQGVGRLHVAYEQLKGKLSAEGLFADEHKQPIPFLPRRVAVITSITGAALRDILSVISRRFPAMDVLIVPAMVQGTAAPESLVQALALVQRVDDVDVVIVARGGGSIEELWAFNDEGVARALFACRIPTISGIGHETDFTIADFVACRRAPTPSAAAELAVPDQAALRQGIGQCQHRLIQGVQKLLAAHRRQVTHWQDSAALSRPQQRFAVYRQRVDELLSRSGLHIDHRRQAWRQRLVGLTGKLDSLSPLATLSRGYAVCQTLDGQLVVQSTQLQPDDRVRVLLKQGQITCRVEKGSQHDAIRRTEV